MSMTERNIVRAALGDLTIRTLGQLPEFDADDADHVECFLEFGNGERISAFGETLVQAFSGLCIKVGVIAEAEGAGVRVN
jgi:hypothetical protein